MRRSLAVEVRLDEGEYFSVELVMAAQNSAKEGSLFAGSQFRPCQAVTPDATAYAKSSLYVMFGNPKADFSSAVVDEELVLMRMLSIMWVIFWT